MADPVQYQARTWAEFLSQIRVARESLGSPPTVWFRGHAKASYNFGNYQVHVRKPDSFLLIAAAFSPRSPRYN